MLQQPSRLIVLTLSIYKAKIVFKKRILKDDTVQTELEEFSQNLFLFLCAPLADKVPLSSDQSHTHTDLLTQFLLIKVD